MTNLYTIMQARGKDPLKPTLRVCKNIILSSLTFTRNKDFTDKLKILHVYKVWFHMVNKQFIDFCMTFISQPYLFKQAISCKYGGWRLRKKKISVYFRRKIYNNYKQYCGKMVLQTYWHIHSPLTPNHMPFCNKQCSHDLFQTFCFPYFPQIMYGNIF